MKTKFDGIRSAAFTLQAGAVASLSDDPDIAFISPDRPVFSSSYNGKLDYGWMTATGLNSMLGTLPYDGTGIGVAVLDSGILNNDDFKDTKKKDRVVYRQNFVPDDTSADDDNGHGTHVAGLIGARGLWSTCADCSYRVRGIAPGVRIVNLRVLDAAGQGTDSTVITAIDRAIQLKTTYNIRVMNLSLGRYVSSSYRNDPLCMAVERAWKAGIVVVVAAGNEGRNNSAGNSGYGTIMAPANDPYVITVGAMNTGEPCRAPMTPSPATAQRDLRCSIMS